MPTPLHTFSDSGRPWPAPRRPWVMRMVWYDLLFAHWAVDAQRLREHLPKGLELDLFDGQAWLGVVPFGMKGIRARGLPPIPGTSRFLELNVRTYVVAEDKPGVWFFSLDAENPLAVRGARTLFGLPYFDAKMAWNHQSEAVIDYRSRRTHRGEPAAEFAGRYQPAGDVIVAAPDTLEHWLTERYCLYSQRRGRLYRGEIDHQRWPLQPAACEIDKNTMSDWLGIALEGPPAHLHFAGYLDVHAWTLDRVG